MRTGTLAFLFGILLLVQLPALPEAYFALFLLPIALLFQCKSPYLRLGCFFAAGFLWALFRAQIIFADKLEKEIEGKTMLATGQIISLPEQKGNRLQFEFNIKSLMDSSGKSWPSPGKVRLNWYRSDVTVKPGQIWRLTIRMKRPYGFMNPGGFDYEKWLFQHRIRATGYVINSPDNEYKDVVNGQYVNRLRNYLRHEISFYCGSDSYAGLILALGLGDRSQINPAQRTVLIRTGTQHLLAISGLHIGLIAGLVFFLARKFWSFGRLPLFMPAPRFASIVAIIAACIYAMLAGLSIPTQRSLVMVTVVMLSFFTNRQHAFSHVICVALLITIILDPFAVMDPGMWLSFIAIIVIAYGMGCRINNDSLWWRWGRTQYVVAIGLAPVLLLFFRQVSLIGIPANLVAIPWVSFIVVPFVLGGMLLINISVTLGSVLLDGANKTIGLLFLFINYLSKPDIVVWHQASLSIWAVSGGLFAAAILLVPRGMPARWLGLLYCIPLIAPLKSSPAEKEFWFSLLDVGQGLSAVVHTRNHTLVYDTGSRFSETFNAGDAVLIPYLRQVGTDHIDMLIISHGDNDHIGGSKSLLAAFPDTPILTSVPGKFKDIVAYPCYDGQRWSWDGVDFQILNPSRNEDNLSGNNRSCVLKVSTESGQILLSGDIEKQAEDHLINKYDENLAATILVAPHHGSKTSSSSRFINAVNPELVLFSAGYRNRYNFPNEDIIDRYESRGIHIYDTAVSGAILTRVEQSGISTGSYRQSFRHFWNTEYINKYK